ncbi:MAG TPA: DPP IV N-terminal domain-containing protein, partial [Chitinophagaceae bacterium]|nr:DPP IV N-terminal domain-containing protein [Chitinophagaceae bacterium]
MAFKKEAKKFNLLLVVQFVFVILVAQPGVPSTKWTADGSSYYAVEKKEIVKIELPSQNKTIFISRKQLITQPGDTLNPRSFQLSPNGKLALIYTNAQRVWRFPTRGDYWLLNLASGQLKQIGKGRPGATLQFAKFSPDNKKVAYVSERNIYIEDLTTGIIKKLTSDHGTKKLINGTFDWVYEEEFFCRDGFRWAPDSKSIAYWQIDANKIRDYYMLNTTDSVYSKIVPVEYPKVGEPPSPARIGVVNISTGQTKWMKIPGEPDQHYLIRMEWSAPGEIILQQLNRKQNESKLMLCNTNTGDAKIIYAEEDQAWVATLSEWRSDVKGWDWIKNGNEFIWFSEKDGWRHLYRISKDGKKETLITKGNYDVIDLLNIDEQNGLVYFYASPSNATQRFLYAAKLDGNSPAERKSP